MIWRLFRESDEGQDLAEYCLITALVALVALGIFIHVSGGVQAIWGTANTTLSGTGSGGTGVSPAARSAAPVR